MRELVVGRDSDGSSSPLPLMSASGSAAVLATSMPGLVERQAATILGNLSDSTTVSPVQIAKGASIVAVNNSSSQQSVHAAPAKDGRAIFFHSCLHCCPNSSRFHFALS